MKIQGQIPQLNQSYPKPISRPQQANQSFSALLEKGVDRLNGAQNVANDKLQAMASGKDVDIHGTMIALQEADITLRFATSVRDKLVEAYQKIINMSV
jgi:flagellar hook-basal body complex protein FliE